MSMHTRDLKTVLAMLTGRAPKRLRKEGAELMERNKDWLSAPEVQGLGIGERIRGGDRTDDLVLKVYVDRKRPGKQVKHAIPAKQKVPGTKWQLEIDVEEVGTIEIESALTGHRRPLRPGYGVSHESGSMGTIGCLVRREGDATGVYMLSCSHVLAKAGTAEKNKDKILQPAKEIDGNVGDGTVATLTDWIPLDLTPGGISVADAAIAKLDGGIEADSRIEMSFRPPRGIAPKANLTRSSSIVGIVGAISGAATGIVRDLHFSFKVNYPGVGATQFTDLVACSSFTHKGDSGAAITTRSGRIAGIHVAGSASMSVFCPIEPILRELKIEIITTRLP